jgi:DNA repair exonuclease SbcCD ATPase subunit
MPYHDNLTHLRAAVEQAKTELIEKEAELADRLAEVHAFEFEFEARVGYLYDQLEALEAEIERYMERLQQVRQKQLGRDYLPVEEQYRRAWQRPAAAAPPPPPQPVSPASETEIKQLYRQLARRFHPDLAADEADRVQRTEKMAAINNAYAARSLTELTALAEAVDMERSTFNVSMEALQAELERCQRRLAEIERELRQVSHRPSVELSLEVKLARRRGRDILKELAADVDKKVARKTVERDMLKAQFDQLGPEQGFIPIDRRK